MRVSGWFVMVTLFLSLALFAAMHFDRQAAALYPAGSDVVSGPDKTARSSAAPLVALPSFAELVKREGPAVVNISTTQNISVGVMPFPGFPGMQPDDPFFEFFRRFSPGDQLQREFKTQSLGSGFIISPDGYIMSNAHVVSNADEIVVRLTDKREFKARVIGIDQRSDIALLKIDASGLPVVTLGDSSKLEVGEWVVAIGSPFGFTNSVSQGIVSAKERSLPGGDVVPFIQTDVPINPGNSGGPLFNLNGEVVGINSQIYSRSGGYMGLSFAIPIDMAIRVKDDLLKHGSVKRGWLGIRIQDVSDEHAKSFDLEKASGVLVASIEKDSPAERAGLQIGDIILKLNGKVLASAGELVRAVSDEAPGARVRLQLWRDGAGKEVTVTLGDAAAASGAKPQTGKAQGDAQLGMSLRELSRDEQRRLQTEAAILVESVTGIAAKSGIQPGDLILAVNSKRVSGIRQLREVLGRAGKRAALLVQRGGNMMFIPLQF
ncbi:MAG: DegQ family serine endoprotease [Gallionellaceae bacterium]